MSLMRFVLPAKYTPETAPRPLNNQVRVVEVPERVVAVLRFTGSTTPKTADQQYGMLRQALENSSWRIAGEPSALYYDPPWTLPFLRRNEVTVPVFEE